jgi:hypothetical protein
MAIIVAFFIFEMRILIIAERHDVLFVAPQTESG